MCHEKHACTAQQIAIKSKKEHMDFIEHYFTVTLTDVAEQGSFHLCWDSKPFTKCIFIFFLSLQRFCIISHYFILMQSWLKCSLCEITVMLQCFFNLTLRDQWAACVMNICGGWHAVQLCALHEQVVVVGGVVICSCTFCVQLYRMFWRIILWFLLSLYASARQPPLNSSRSG